MPAKSAKIKKSAKRLFTGTEVGVLLEDIDQKLGYIADGVSMLRQRVDILERKIENMFETLGEVKIDIAIMKEDIRLIKKELTRKISYDEFRTLEKRVAILESKVL